MAGQRQPVEVLVAKGAKHLSQEEIEERLAAEVKAPVPDKKKITPPRYLPKDLKREFKKLAAQLIDLQILSHLDYDVLARYLIAQKAYNELSKLQEKILAQKTMGDDDSLDQLERVSRLMERHAKQCRAGANDLGLTISSRCRLVIPQVQAPQEHDPNGDLFG